MKFELLEVAGTHIFSMKAMTLVLFFIFAIIVVGYLVGKISIKGVSLGSAAIFLVALRFAQNRTDRMGRWPPYGPRKS